MKSDKPNSSKTPREKFEDSTQWRNLKIILKILGPLTIILSMLPISYVALSIYRGSFHWITRRADFIVSRTDNFGDFWLYACFTGLGGIALLLCGIILIKNSPP